MKFSGVSWSQSYHNKHRGKIEIACSECKRRYTNSDAKEKHQRLCKEYWESKNDL